jgi:broad specificity phosphatase PhoE
VRLLLVSHAMPGRPGADLSPAARARAADLARLLPRPRAAFTSPAPCAVQTAAALGLRAATADALRDQEDDSLAVLSRRAADWLAEQARESGTRVAVTHAAVIRAAAVAVLAAPAAAFPAIEVAPCSVTELAFRDGRWHLAHVNWEPTLLQIPQRRGRRRPRASRPQRNEA